MTATSSSTRRKPVFYGYVIVGVAFLVMAVTAGGLFSFSVFFAPLQAEFGWSRAVTSGAFASYMVMQGTFSIVAGRLNDRFGPRVILSVCSLLSGLGFILASRIDAVWELYLLYGLLVAAGASGAPVPLMSTVVRWFQARRGMMTGIVMAGVGVGTMVMPPFATWLIEAYSWRSSFIVVGLLLMLITMVAAQFLKRDPSQLGLQPLGSDAAAAGASPTAGSAGHGFSDAIRTRQAWFLAVAFGGFGFTVHTITVHVVVHAMDIGLSPGTAAAVMTAIGALGVVGRIGVGGMADRLGSKRLLVVQFGILSLTLFWLAVVRQPWSIFAFAFVFGFAFGGIVPLYSHFVAHLFGLRAHGSILGTIGFSIGVGSAIGPVFTGYCYDILGSYALPFTVCGVIAAASALFISIVRPPRAIHFEEEIHARTPEPPFPTTL